MSSNFVLLNAERTEMQFLGAKQIRNTLSDLTLKKAGSIILQSNIRRNLGVLFDPNLSFENHINNITKTAYFHLRNIAKIHSILSMADAETLVQHLVQHLLGSSRLYYCNTLFIGLPKSTTRKLQLLHNITARILTRTRKFDHIVPVLISLLWFPVPARSDFKMLF